jgi:hypothetical protein
MSDMTKQQCFLSRTSVTETVHMPLRLTAVAAGLLLMMMPFLTGCGGDGGESAPPAGATASLAWNPVQDSSVHSYIVHYGRQSPGQSGNCEYESSIRVNSPSATVTNLEPNTLYYFTVSADNDLESACSNEVSTVTPPPPSVQTDPRSPNRPVQTDPRSPNRAPEVPRYYQPGRT